MPNWCDNCVTLTTEDEDLAKWLIKTDFDFNKILPIPGPKNAWNYDTAIHLWGTKWTANFGDENDIVKDRFNYSVSTESGKTIHKIGLGFQTPWNAPSGIYKTLVTLGFDIDAKFVEEGMEFCGRYTKAKNYCSGDIIDEEYYNSFPAWNDDVAWEGDLFEWVDDMTGYREYKEEEAEECDSECDGNHEAEPWCYENGTECTCSVGNCAKPTLD